MYTDRMRIRACVVFALIGAFWVAGLDAISHFHNPTAITIPATGTSGPAAPYPSNIIVTGLVGTVKRLEVTIRTYNHTFPDDLDVLLVGPGGQAMIIMSDAGGSADAVGATVTLTDAAASQIPDGGPISAGSFQPSGFGTGDTFPAPAPVVFSQPAPAGTATLTSTFGGTNPNGTWSLYVFDDVGGDVGNFLNGWSLSIVVDAPLDYDGDAKTDWVVVRNTGGGPSGQITWFMLNSLGFTAVPFGAASDFFLSGDYDGDKKSDVVVWRGGASSVFYRLNSSNGAFIFQPFGTSGDDPTIPGDYDGDGVTDMAVYRAGAAALDPSFWYAIRSSNGSILTQQWGQNGDFPAPGDYDGDRRGDFVVQRNGGGGQGVFFIRFATGSQQTVYWGTPSDVIVPGDYDGDGNTDIAVVRGTGGAIHWHVRRSSDGGYMPFIFGASATDFPTQGDYDGDGRTDVAVWRPNATPGQTAFYVLLSNAGGVPNTFVVQQWGQNGDYPVANFNSH